MYRSLICGLVFSTILPAVAIAQQPPKESPVAAFVNQLARSDLHELAWADLAHTRATDTTVKALALKLIAEHKRRDVAIRDLGRKKDITVVSELAEDEKKAVAALGKLSERAFDRRYIGHVITDYVAMVTLVARQPTESQDADVRAFAKEWLESMRALQKEVQEIRDQIGGEPEKPEKPDKPEKPEKPEKPDPADKPKKPGEPPKEPFPPSPDGPKPRPM